MKSNLNKINPDRNSQRAGLRGLGIALVVVGGIFTLIGLVSFFSAFGSIGKSPDYFWCAFIGLPMLGGGIKLVKYSYLGKISRYIAGETASPIKDTLSYLRGKTQEEGETPPTKLKVNSNHQEKKTVEERLSNLKRLRDKDVINEAEYQDQRDRILEDL